MVAGGEWWRRKGGRMTEEGGGGTLVKTEGHCAWPGWWTPRKTYLLVLDNMGICLQVNTCFCGEEKYVWGRVMADRGGVGREGAVRVGGRTNWWSVWPGWWTARETYLLVLDNMGICVQVNTCFCGEDNRYICGGGGWRMGAGAEGQWGGGGG